MMTVPIEVSARHVHLAKEHIQKLFGHDLRPLHPISQKGQYAAKETVTLEAQRSKHRMQSKSHSSLRVTRHALRNVRVVGPARDESQVELALLDCRLLGLKNVPLKVSGSLRGTPGITLVGPKGTVVLKQGVIVAQRHIHCSTQKAKHLGLKDGQIVKVKVSGKRGVIFENVVVRVRNDFVWRMHIDTDEANATNLVHGGVGVVDVIHSSTE